MLWKSFSTGDWQVPCTAAPDAREALFMYRALHGRIRLRTFLAAALLVAASYQPSVATDRIMLISWDGIRRDVLTELLQWQDESATPVACPNKRHAPFMPVSSMTPMTDANDAWSVRGALGLSRSHGLAERKSRRVQCGH